MKTSVFNDHSSLLCVPSWEQDLSGADCSPRTLSQGRHSEGDAAAWRTLRKGTCSRDALLPSQTAHRSVGLCCSFSVLEDPFLQDPEPAHLLPPQEGWRALPRWWPQQNWPRGTLISDDLEFKPAPSSPPLFFFFFRKTTRFREKDIKIKLKIGPAWETDSSQCLLNNPSPAVCIFLLIKAIWIPWKEHFFFLTKPIITLSCTHKKSLSSPFQAGKQKNRFFHSIFLPSNTTSGRTSCFAFPFSAPPCPFHPQNDGVAHFEHVKATPGKPFSTFVWTPLTQCMLTDSSS